MQRMRNGEFTPDEVTECHDGFRNHLTRNLAQMREQGVIATLTSRRLLQVIPTAPNLSRQVNTGGSSLSLLHSVGSTQAQGGSNPSQIVGTEALSVQLPESRLAARPTQSQLQGVIDFELHRPHSLTQQSPRAPTEQRADGNGLASDDTPQGKLRDLAIKRRCLEAERRR